MYIQPEASIVRIFATSGAAVGTGFLVSEDTVLTCAHVVAAALCLRDCPQKTPASEVMLDFPLIAAQQKLLAHAIFWQSPLPNGGGDIALLHLKDALPDGANAARMVMTDGDLWRHDFRAFGFPNYHEQGVWASGKLRAREASGWVQIEDVKEVGHRVQPGFSGGAVWDEQLEGVAGMVVAAEEDAKTRVAYMIPTTVLVKAAPQLGEQTIPSCPYRGLAAFREQDVPYFFGRESFTQQVVETVRKKPLLAVVGSSGSGKSSAIFAGLIPRLRNEGRWLITSFRPSNDPFRSLAEALLPLLEPQKSEIERLIERNKLARYLQQGELALQDVIERIVQRLPGTRLLLVADQFEELYTLCPEQELREGFLKELLTVVRAATALGALTFNLVLTLRADFMGQALSYRPFADALQYADLKLGPMNSKELQDAIKKPAEKLHVRIEDGLTERILKEVSREPSHLPLLEFALTLLWDKQRERKLTNAAYEEIGGIEQALAKHAEEIYAGLNEDEQQRAQQIFLQLVRPGEGTEDTRRLATRAEVGENNWELVVRLSSWSARLVVTGRDTTTREEAVEVIHEALIRGWQRLRDWMEEHREFRTWQERLRAALRQWERNRKDTGALLRGALLVEALRWQKQRQGAISPAEQAFIDDSEAYQTQEAQRWKDLYEEAERQRQEIEQQRLFAEQRQQEAERLQLLAEQHRQEAEEERKHAHLHQQIALARQLAAQSELIRNQYPRLLERSVLLAVEAMRRFSSLEADQALRNGLALFPQRPLAQLSFGGDPWAASFSPDGNYLAIASQNGSVGVWNTKDWGRIALLAHKGPMRDLTFSPDGHYLVTASWDRTAKVWETTNWHHLISLTHKKAVLSIAFSPDGRYLLTGSKDCTAKLWDTSNWKEIASLLHEKDILDVAFSPNGHYYATASHDCTVKVWEVNNIQEVAMLTHEGPVNTVVFSPDSTCVATASEDHTARVWEIPDDHEIAFLPHSGPVFALAYSPDGTYLATASGEHTAKVWEVNLGYQLLHQLLHKQDIQSVSFNSNGNHLATASSDGTAGIWEAKSGRQLICLTQDGEVHATTFSPDGNSIVIASNGSAKVWGTTSNYQRTHLSHTLSVESLAFSPDGHYLATASHDGTARIWAMSTKHQIARLAHKDGINNISFSPDDKYIATASSDGTAGIWLWKPEDLISEAQCHLTRNLTQDEWEQYLSSEPYRKTCPNHL